MSSTENRRYLRVSNERLAGFRTSRSRFANVAEMKITSRCKIWLSHASVPAKGFSRLDSLVTIWLIRCTFHRPGGYFVVVESWYEDPSVSLCCPVSLFLSGSMSEGDIVPDAAKAGVLTQEVEIDDWIELRTERQQPKLCLNSQNSRFLAS